mgnify:CR=1 FL=1
MGHSDEWTFADYFRYEKEIYRAIISAAVLCQWIAEHDIWELAQCSLLELKPTLILYQWKNYRKSAQPFLCR